MKLYLPVLSEQTKRICWRLLFATLMLTIGSVFGMFYAKHKWLAETDYAQQLLRDDVDVEDIGPCRFVYPRCYHLKLPLKDAVKRVTRAKDHVEGLLGPFQEPFTFVIRDRLSADGRALGWYNTTLKKIELRFDTLLSGDSSPAHELVHRRIFELGSPLQDAYFTNEGIAHLLQDPHHCPEDLLEILQAKGPLSKQEILAVQLEQDAGEKAMQIRASGWCSLYYLLRIRALPLEVILQMPPKDMPDPRTVWPEVERHALMITSGLKTYRSNLLTGEDKDGFDSNYFGVLLGSGPVPLSSNRPKALGKQLSWEIRVKATSWLLFSRAKAVEKKQQLEIQQASAEKLEIGLEAWQEFCGANYDRYLIRRGRELFQDGYGGLNPEAYFQLLADDPLFKEEAGKAAPSSVLQQRAEATAWAVLYQLHNRHYLYSELRQQTMLPEPGERLVNKEFMEENWRTAVLCAAAQQNTPKSTREIFLTRTLVAYERDAESAGWLKGRVLPATAAEAKRFCQMRKGTDLVEELCWLIGNYLKNEKGLSPAQIRQFEGPLPRAPDILPIVLQRLQKEENLKKKGA